MLPKLTNHMTVVQLRGLEVDFMEQSMLGEEVFVAKITAVC